MRGFLIIHCFGAINVFVIICGSQGGRVRNSFFDVLKFFAMVLVVYGHVTGAFKCEWGRPFVGNFIIGMNMPLFFIISGYFSERTIEHGDWRKLGRHIFGYFWPMALVSIVFAVFAVAFHIPGCENGLVGYAGRRFLFSPWFLWCLSYCYIAVFICCRPKLRILRWGALFLLIISLPCLHGVWHVNNVRAMLPYFIFGVFVLSRWELWKNKWIGGPCLIVYLAVVLLQGDIGTNGLSFYGVKTTWAAFFSDSSAFPFYLARLANGILGSIGIMWAVQLLCDNCKVTIRLAPLGMTTLWVYILHQWLLDRVVSFGWYDSSIMSAFVWMALLFGFSHICGLGVRRVENIW